MNERAADVHTCEECDRRDPVWVADSVFWDRLHDVQPHRFLCPTCFIVLYEFHVAPLLGAWFVSGMDYTQK